jgi:hypothetical protein
MSSLRYFLFSIAVPAFDNSILRMLAIDTFDTIDAVGAVDAVDTVDAVRCIAMRLVCELRFPSQKAAYDSLDPTGQLPVSKLWR